MKNYDDMPDEKSNPTGCLGPSVVLVLLVLCFTGCAELWKAHPYKITGNVGFIPVDLEIQKPPFSIPGLFSGLTLQPTIPIQ
jgi:hypothetical protein